MIIAATNPAANIAEAALNWIRHRYSVSDSDAFSGALDRNPERFEKCRSVWVKAPPRPQRTACSARTPSWASWRHFVEPIVASSISRTSNRAADILHHTRNLIALNYRLVDCLAKLLNQFRRRDVWVPPYFKDRRPALVEAPVAA